MPRIIVTADPVSSQLTDETPVLFDEDVHSVHLSTGHAAAQLIERLAWAISDAENAERAGSDRPERPDRQPSRLRTASRSRTHARRPVRA